MFEQKRGLSQIVESVLLLLITIAAVSLIASFIIPFVRNNLNSGTECVPYRDYYQFDEETDYTCYKNNYTGASVKASASPEGNNTIGFEIVFVKAGLSEKASVRKSNSESCACKGIKMLGTSCSSLGIVEIPDNGELRTYVYNGTQIFESVDIYPVLNNGKVCDKSDSIKLKACNPGILLS